MTYANNTPELEREPLDLITTFCTIARKTVEELFADMLTMLGDLPGYTEVKYDAQNSNFIWAIPTNPSPIALVAHLDIVGRTPPKEFDVRSGIIKTKGGGILGADDRAGLLAILAILHKGFRPTLFLTTGEEVGGIGAKDLAQRHTPPDATNVLIEFDRKGYNDFVTYSNTNATCNAYFEQFGFEKAAGSYTDIETLQKAWSIAGVNLSIGYYAQHTQNETLFVPQAAHTIDRACEMLNSPPTERLAYTPYVAPSYNHGSSYYGGSNGIGFASGFSTVNGLGGGRALDPSCGRYRVWNYVTKAFQDSDCYNIQTDIPDPKNPKFTLKVWAIKGDDGKAIVLDNYPQPPKTTPNPKTNIGANTKTKGKDGAYYRKATDSDLRVITITVTHQQHGVTTLTERKQILPAILHDWSDYPLRLGALIYLPHLNRWGTVATVTRSGLTDPPPQQQNKKTKKEKKRNLKTKTTTSNQETKDTDIILDSELAYLIADEETRDKPHNKDGSRLPCNDCHLVFPISELDNHGLCYRCQDAVAIERYRLDEDNAYLGRWEGY